MRRPAQEGGEASDAAAGHRAGPGGGDHRRGPPGLPPGGLLPLWVGQGGVLPPGGAPRAPGELAPLAAGGPLPGAGALPGGQDGHRPGPRPGQRLPLGGAEGAVLAGQRLAALAQRQRGG